MTRLAAAAVVATMIAVQSPPAPFESAYVDHDFELAADPQTPEWRAAPSIEMGHDYFGKPIVGDPTVIRSRWSNTYLYLLYACPYDELNLRPNPNPAVETPQLWNHDVAELFIGWDADRINSYKEFQVSPQGEWIDLAIDRDNPKGQGGMGWNSGYTVKARIDRDRKIWYGAMRIPIAAIDERTTPLRGRVFRAGFFRIAGATDKKHYAWSPPGRTSFHVPAAFGQLILR